MVMDIGQWTDAQSIKNIQKADQSLFLQSGPEV